MLIQERRNLRNMHLAICAILISNLILLGTTFGSSNWRNNTILAIPQVATNIFVLCYIQACTMLKVRRHRLRVGFSIILATVYVVYGSMGQGQDLVLLINGINFVLSFLFVIEAGMRLSYARREEARQEEDEEEQGGSDDTTTAASVDVEVHFYQPPLSLTPSRSGSVITIPSPTAQPSRNEPTRTQADAWEGRGDRNNGIELEELPKYQKRPPAQSAVIVDLSNLDYVSPDLISRVQRQGLANPGHDADQTEVGESPAYTPSHLATTSGAPSSLSAAAARSTEESTMSSSREERSEQTSTSIRSPSPDPTLVPSSQPPVYQP